MRTLLRVAELSKRFTIHTLGNKIIEGCQGVSFRLGQGDFLGIAGPSGSGKSTILKCIYRTYLPTGGTIWYDSLLYGWVNLAAIDDHLIIGLRHKEIGFVSQFLKVIPRVSALEIVAEPLLLKNGASPKEARNKAKELLEKLNISPKLYEAYPATFSGGEQQRINIARAIIWKPRLLLLDEPTASLDDASTQMVIQLLKEMREEGTSMIGIFHDHTLMESITDQVYDMNQQGGGDDL
ncbi:MAG: phosphonate C-P lyase system protein PhnL [Syntrophales bacterium LBB04]|nr:phosphonate C-P lyase system protein PhnL [Syntrophales bacterium LBB04]